MYLVHEDRVKGGRWQVAWTWLPFFLASDGELHKWVAEKMTKEFKGTTLEGDVHSMYPPSMIPILVRMHNKVIALILEKYPIPGLQQYLESVMNVQPEEELEES